MIPWKQHIFLAVIISRSLVGRSNYTLIFWIFRTCWLWNVFQSNLTIWMFALPPPPHTHTHTQLYFPYLLFGRPIFGYVGLGLYQVRACSAKIIIVAISSQCKPWIDWPIPTSKQDISRLTNLDCIEIKAGVMLICWASIHYLSMTCLWKPKRLGTIW